MSQAEALNILPALIGAGSALLVAIIAAWLAYRRFLQEQRHRQNALLSALFGELANIYEHYSVAAPELPFDVRDELQLKLRLQYSRYGELHSVKDVSEYGFLSADDVRLLLQLSLRIRNTDLFLDSLLADLPRVRVADLESARGRMFYGISTTHQLIQRLALSRPKLKAILAAIERDFPSLRAKKT